MATPTNSGSLKLLVLTGLCGIPMLMASPTVDAGSSSAGEEFLSNAEAAPPNVLFLLDLSKGMNDACGPVTDSGDGADTDDSGDTATTSSTYDSCLEYAVDAVDNITRHFDWAYFGVVGTTDSATDNNLEAIAPLGSSHSEVQTALNSVTSSGTNVRNLAEVLGAAWTYFSYDGSSSCKTTPCLSSANLTPTHVHLCTWGTA